MMKRYLIATYIVTWSCWTIYALSVPTLNFTNHMGILMMIGLLAPTIFAFLFATPEQKAQWRQFRSPLSAYAVALLLPISFGIAGALVSGDAIQWGQLLSWFPALAASLLFGGLEEFGWRGLLLPSLLTRFRPWQATLLTSIAWTIWHIPLFFIAGSGQYGTFFPAYALELLMYSFWLTILYMRTRNIWLAVLFHASFNAISYTGIYVDKTSFAYVGFHIVLLVIAISVLHRLSPRPDASFSSELRR